MIENFGESNNETAKWHHLRVLHRNDPVQAPRRIIVEANVHGELTGGYPAPLGGLVDMEYVSFCGEY